MDQSARLESVSSEGSPQPIISQRACRIVRHGAVLHRARALSWRNAHPGCNVALIFRILANFVTALVAAAGPHSTVHESIVQEPRHDVLTVTEANFSGRLLAMTAEGEMTFSTAEGERKLPLAEFLTWGTPVDPPSFSRLATYESARLIFTNGSQFTADVLAADAQTLHAESRLLDTLDVPLEQLAAILIVPPNDPRRADELTRQLLEGESRTDRLLLANGDVIEGAFVALREVNTDRVIVWQGAADELSFPITNTRGIVFGNRTSVADPAFRKFRVGMSEGSLIWGSELRIENDMATVTPFPGAAWKLPAVKLAWVEYANPAVTWLAEEQPAQFQQVPFLSGSWGWGANRNVHGDPLSADGQRYLHGIGVHSAAQLTYALREPEVRFEAEIALDDSARPLDGSPQLGSAIFRVYTFHRRDGQVVREERYASSHVRAGDSPLPVSVDLTDAVGLRLVVEYGESGDQQDDADWLNARLIRAKE